jgi:hypothetical protein
VSATCPAVHILLDLITVKIFGEEYVYEVPRCASFSYLLGPNILHSTKFSNSFNGGYSLRERAQVSHQCHSPDYFFYVTICHYKAKLKNKSLYIISFLQIILQVNMKEDGDTGHMRPMIRKCNELLTCE